MYVSARKITAVNGRMEDTTAFATMLTQRINEKLGSDLGLAIEVGGDPNVLWLNGRWESLGDFQKFNEAYYADPQLVAAAAVTDSVASVTSDQINRIHRAPGDRNAFAVVSTGRIQMENFLGAMAFMDELAEFKKEQDKLKNKISTKQKKLSKVELKIASLEKKIAEKKASKNNKEPIAASLNN